MLEYTIFFLGIVGIMQMFVLPGGILLRYTKSRPSMLKWLVLAAAISLTFNYALVLVLTVSGLMKSDVVRVLVCLECVLFVYLYRHSLGMRLVDCSSGYSVGGFSKWCFKGSNVASKVVLFMVSAIILLKFLFILQAHMGEIFHVDDEVHSWNRWALAWAGGRMPSTGLYPQLIPTNYALLYTIMGHLPGKDFLVTFARSVMPLFSILCLLMGFDLLFKQQKERYLIAIPLLGLVILGMLGKYVPRGYVDIPLAFFALTAVYYFQEACFAKRSLSFADLCLFAIVCAGCGVAKQGGLYLTLFWPAIAVYYWQQKALINRGPMPYLLVYAFGLLITLPWYLVIQDFFRHGLNGFNVHHLSSDMWQGRGSSVWIVKLSNLLKRSWIIVVLSLFAVIDVVKHSSWRIPMVFTFPYVIIWAVASPDPRNISFAIPVLVFSSSGMLADYCMGSSGWLSKVTKTKVAYLLGGVLLVLVIASTSKNLQYQSLLKHQNAAIHQYTDGSTISTSRFQFLPS